MRFAKYIFCFGFHEFIPFYMEKMSKILEITFVCKISHFLQDGFPIDKNGCSVTQKCVLKLL